jgi:hypothetical protein
LAEVGRLEVVEVRAPVEALLLRVAGEGRRVIVEGRADRAVAGPAHLVVPLLHVREQLALRPRRAVRAGVPVQAAPAPVVRVEEQEAFPRHVPRLGIGEVGLEDLIERGDAVGFAALEDEGRPCGAVAAREDPDVARVVERDDGVVVGVGGLLVDEHDRAREGPRGVVVVRHHLEERVLVFRGAAVDEEGLVRLRRVDGHRDVVHRVGAQAAAVFVDVFVVGGLVHVPDPAVAGRDRGRRWLFLPPGRGGKQCNRQR